MPALDAPPERPSAQVIDIQAVRLERWARDTGRSAEIRAAAPMRLFTPPRPGLLNERERLALTAVAEHAARKVIARRNAAFILPIPAGRAGLVDRLFGGAL